MIEVLIFALIFTGLYFGFRHQLTTREHLR